jgi:hypothetical protein
VVEGLGNLVEGLSGEMPNPQVLVDAYFSLRKLRIVIADDYS